MSQGVKLSRELVLDARLTGGAMKRTIAGQVEYWARLGLAIETLLDGTTAIALARRGAARPLSECFASVGTSAGRKRLAAALAAKPFPHYEPADEPGLLVRIDANGVRTVGRFVNRAFKPIAKRPRREPGFRLVRRPLKRVHDRSRR